MSHVELNWEYAFYADLLEPPRRRTARLIVLDKRGTGPVGPGRSASAPSRSGWTTCGRSWTTSGRAGPPGRGVRGRRHVRADGGDPPRAGRLARAAGRRLPGRVRLDDRGGKPAILDFVERNWSTGRVLDFFIQNPTGPGRQALAAWPGTSATAATPSIAREIMRRTLESDVTRRRPDGHRADPGGARPPRPGGSASPTAEFYARAHPGGRVHALRPRLPRQLAARGLPTRPSTRSWSS